MKSQKKKAQRQSTAPNNNQSHHTRYDIICLILFITFFGCLTGGYIIDNLAMRFFGAGVGFALLLITTDFNLHEED